MKLGKLQEEFAHAEACLILEAYGLGYRVRGGDAFRDPRVHGKMGVKKGYGRRNSLHKLKLARDLNLFKDGKYLNKTKDHKILGKWWEKEYAEFNACWGGRFQDGNHYSFAYRGFR